MEDGNHIRCTAPLEQEDSKQGATIRAVSPVTMVRWRKLFTAVMHLLAYTLLNAGIAMIVHHCGDCEVLKLWPRTAITFCHVSIPNLAVSNEHLESEHHYFSCCT